MKIKLLNTLNYEIKLSMVNQAKSRSISVRFLFIKYEI